MEIKHEQANTPNAMSDRQRIGLALGEFIFGMGLALEAAFVPGPNVIKIPAAIAGFAIGYHSMYSLEMDMLDRPEE